MSKKQTNSTLMKDSEKIFYGSATAALCSFIFGVNQTSFSVLMPKLHENYVNHGYTSDFAYLESVFAFIVFLGAFGSSSLIFLFSDISRKHILVANNFVYFIGTILLCIFDNLYVLLIGRFLIGAAAGVACCTVPSYIFSITGDESRGFYMSFHSIGEITGMVVGKALSVYMTDTGWFTLYYLLSVFIAIHTLALLTIKNNVTMLQKDKQASIIDLIKKHKARKSLFLALSFHIAQHASGIDYFSAFTEQILNACDDPGKMSIFSLVFSAFVGVLCCTFIDKCGRKPMMILSISTIILSTLFMGFEWKNMAFVLLYMFGFNIGLASIPWFITNEIFPAEYLNAALRLTVSVNWFSAFTVSCLLKILQANIDQKHHMFLVYSGLMMIFLIIVVLMFKETKNETVGFQK